VNCSFLSRYTVAESALSVSLIWLAAVVIAFWLALVVWTWRDMRARSRDVIGQVVAAVSVIILFVPGLFVYLLLRPRETITEAYERSLEEEALLQEIEEHQQCPGCGQRLREDWQVCPACHTRVRKPCRACGRLLDLTWELCPHCATSQVIYGSNDPSVRMTDHVSLTTPPEIEAKWLAGQPSRAARSGSGSVEYIEG
jgi:RNA polymerase subunit RPABC4/transcription elongation factor Spt4